MDSADYRSLKSLVISIFFQLIDSGNHHSPTIKARCDQLNTRLDEIAELARRRLQRLQDNSAYLQFMWKCDVVESWIGKYFYFPFSVYFLYKIKRNCKYT